MDSTPKSTAPSVPYLQTAQLGPEDQGGIEMRTERTSHSSDELRTKVIESRWCIANTAGEARAFIQATENRAEATGKKFHYLIRAEEVKP
jgi:hypothetical protein